MIGRTVGSYQIVEKLGSGGMGEVYRAVHPLLGRPAAVKVLLPEMCREETALNRFFQEARSTALVGHPGIVDIFDYGHTEDGHAYLVMELLQGETLTARLKREERLSPSQAVAIARQIAGAVGAAHTAGVVHRDLKPDNLFLLPVRDSANAVRLKVLDFGIAKLADRARPSHVTQAGIALGSPRYMAPEQCRNAAGVDGRADVYSLGCILHEMLSGAPPFDKPSFAELMAAQLALPAPPLRTLVPSLPEALEQVVLRALAKDPAERYQSMDEMVDALEAVGPNLRDSVPLAVAAAPLGNTALVSSARGSTTLGHAASQVGVPSVSGRRLLLPIGVGAAFGLIAFVLFLVLRSYQSPGPVSEVVQGPVPGLPAPSPAASPSPSSAPEAPSPSPQATVEAPAIVMLRVDSVPTGAEVYRKSDGVRVGKTPVVHETQKVEGEMVFLLKLSGHETGEAVISAARDGQVTVKLKRDKHRKRERKLRDDSALDPFD